MFKCAPGPLKSKEKQKQLIIEILNNIDNTKNLINYINNNMTYSAIRESNNLDLSDHIKNKIGRLKWQV